MLRQTAGCHFGWSDEGRPPGYHALGQWQEGRAFWVFRGSSKEETLPGAAAGVGRAGAVDGHRVGGQLDAAVARAIGCAGDAVEVVHVRNDLHPGRHVARHVAPDVVVAVGVGDVVGRLVRIPAHGDAWSGNPTLDLANVKFKGRGSHAHMVATAGTPGLGPRAL